MSICLQKSNVFERKRRKPVDFVSSRLSKDIHLFKKSRPQCNVHTKNKHEI